MFFVYPMTGAPGVPNPPDWDTIPGAHGSTPEAEGFRDAYANFELLGYEIFGVSGQLPAAQDEFSTRAGIPYLLLSDEKHAFANALRLPRFETGGVTYLKRLTMIIKDGTIYRVVYPVHPPATHAHEVLQSLRSARA